MDLKNGLKALVKICNGQKVSATLKSCIPKSDGNECDRIAALDNLLKVPGFKTDFGGGCYTCEKDGCNHASGPAKASLTLLAAISLFSLLWCFSNKS
ncbi:hypothetical protein NQ318_022443 [Aromia moschata]|uniref:Uncharacterized protein n=1 Tax=Aromia moschata TaxID=1265417 RepID=A0AAV8Z7E3_9CUCU|nr:hypothetical protein NQ318_022443 [Aromia moschata]